MSRPQGGSSILPNDILRPLSSSIVLGPGTYVEKGNVRAAVAGQVLVAESKSGQTLSVTTMTVSTSTAAAAEDRGTRTTSSTATSSIATVAGPIPDTGRVAMARVTRLSNRQASVDILVLDDRPCRVPWAGIIRSQDVRQTDRDRVKIGECFRVGDVVRGAVISLGDQQNYYISTASDYLGVVLATSATGNTMYPVSWQEMRDPMTGKSETRKVAKPF